MFLPGKIYYATYTNFKHDRNPLILVFYSSPTPEGLTHALNLHYLPSNYLLQLIEFLKKFEKKFNYTNLNLGKTLYKIFKNYFPNILKLAYRTYKTRYLSGILINEGITTPSPTIVHPTITFQIKNDQIVKLLNEALKSSSLLETIPKTPTTEKFVKL
jgi:hypothetical protein